MICKTAILDVKETANHTIMDEYFADCLADSMFAEVDVLRMICEQITF